MPREGEFSPLRARGKRMQWRAMNVHVLPAGPLETNAYLLTSPERGEAVLIDAPLDVWPEVRDLLAEEKCTLKELWLTHGHFDHMEGAAEVLKATGAMVRAHPADREMFETPERMRWFIEMFLPNHPLIEPVKTDVWLKDGDRFEALGGPVEVRHVPGHAAGNVAFVLPTLGAAFVGDSLFAGAVGRTDLPGGSFETLANSIREQLYSLPETTTVFPGHGPRTTVGAEKRGNPYVNA